MQHELECLQILKGVWAFQSLYEVDLLARHVMGFLTQGTQIMPFSSAQPIEKLAQYPQHRLTFILALGPSGQKMPHVMELDADS